MSQRLDLVYPLRGENRRVVETGLTDLAGPYSERWTIGPRGAGIYWTVRRRRLDAEAITCVVRGFQELLYWPLTTYRGPATGLVAVEHPTDADEIRVILRGDVLDILRATPWGNSHIHLYDWRLTWEGEAWQAEARRSGNPAWTVLARSAPSASDPPEVQSVAVERVPDSHAHWSAAGRDGTVET